MRGVRNKGKTEGRILDAMCEGVSVRIYLCMCVCVCVG